MSKKIPSQDSNSKGFDDMSIEELVAYFNKHNFYMEDCNCPEVNRTFVRLRDKYGEIKPNPQTGLGVFPPYE